MNCTFENIVSPINKYYMDNFGSKYRKTNKILPEWEW